MKIKAAKVIVTCPGRNSVTLKVITDEGIQEYLGHTPETDAVFPHGYTFSKSFPHPGETPGHGVDIPEKLAAKYPYQRAFLPVNRLEDGTMWYW